MLNEFKRLCIGGVIAKISIFNHFHNFLFFTIQGLKRPRPENRAKHRPQAKRRNTEIKKTCGKTEG